MDDQATVSSAVPEELLGKAPAPPARTGHPAGFYFIFFGEMAERFSYYGMRAILPLYLTTVLAFPDDKATTIYSLFKGACYLLPLLGGFLADRYFGKYWTIVGFSVPYVLGHFVLGIENRVALVLALALLAGGSGVIKPNISTLMGLTYDQKRPGQEALRSSAFLWFYFAINIGATISLFSLPEIREHMARLDPAQTATAAGTAVGGLAGPAGQPWAALGAAASNEAVRQTNYPHAYKVAFQFPAWLMVLSLGIFAAGKRQYAVEVPGARHELTDEERRQRWATLTTLFGIFALMVFFWVAYEQNDNLWTFFARDHIDRTLNLGFTTKEFAPDQFQFINGVLVLVFAPLFGWFFRAVDPHARVFKATTKILIGFLVTAAASVVMSLAAAEAADGTMVSAWWIVAAYFVLTVGEVLLYGTGLELAFTAAPANMKGFITACFLVTNFLGNLINSQLSPFYKSAKSSPDSFHIDPAPFFAMSAGIVLAAAVAFVFVGRRFNQAQAAHREEAA
jgi:POT family proton-dependent oligopeptide transporter